MKKHIIFIVGIFYFLFPFISHAYDIEVDGIYYNINVADKTASVTRGEVKYTGEVKIPSEISYGNQKLPVIIIGEKAFYESKELTSVTIPNSVTSIGYDAFGKCTSLTSITIPNSVTSIGIYAFSGCRSLTSITIPNSVTSIGYYAFSSCTSLTSITIPTSVTSIESSTFYGCTGLTSVTIGNSVTSIGSEAFNGCTGLTSVTIGNSVTSIGHDAFRRCTGLTSVTIPNSVTSIEYNAFEDCTGLTSVTIGNSVTSIGNRAFNGCTGLTSVTIPNSVTSIGISAFGGCSGLKKLNIIDGKDVLDLEVTSFSAQSPIEEIYLGRNIKKRSQPIFNNNTFNIISLGKYVTIPEIDPSKSENLEIINCYGEIPPSVVSFTTLQYANVIVNIPQGCLENYKNNSTWGNFWNLKETLPNPNPIINAEKVVLNVESSEIAIGTQLQLEVTVLPENATDKTIKWVTSDEKVATVDESGLVKAIAVGKATITASCGEVSAKCEVTVSPIPAEKIILSETELKMSIDDSKQLEATVMPEDTTDKSVNWTTSDEKVVTVDETGLVQAIGAGKATVTATSGEVSATCEVTVYDSNINIEVSENGLEITVEGINQPVQTSIFTVFGQCILRKDAEAEVVVKQEIDLSKLISGSYVITVVSGDLSKNQTVVK